MFFKKNKKKTGCETPEYKAAIMPPPLPRVFDTLPDARKARMISHVCADKKARERKDDAFKYLLSKMEEHCKEGFTSMYGGALDIVNCKLSLWCTRKEVENFFEGKGYKIDFIEDGKPDLEKISWED